MVYKIRVISLEEDAQTAYVAADKFTIGSLSTLPVVIRDKSVEKKHLVISTVDSQIWLTDQDSQQGTLVEGKALSPSVPFHYCAGQKITLGKSKFVLEIYLFIMALDKDMDSVRILHEADERIKEVEQAKLREIEASLTKAKADSDAFRANARHQAEEIVQIAKEKADDIVQAELKAQQKHVKMEVDRSKSEILKLAKEEAAGLLVSTLEAAKAEAEAGRAQMLAAAAEEVEAIQERANEKGSEIIERADAEAEAIVKKALAVNQEKASAAFQRAEQEAHLRGEKLVAEIEAKALETMKEREQNAKVQYGQALKQAEELLNAAREQAARIHQQTTLILAEERTMGISKVMGEATLAAEAIKDTARKDAEKILESARHQEQAVIAGTEKQVMSIFDDARKKADRAVQEQQGEAVKIVDAAQKSAREIKDRAQIESNSLITQARQLTNEMQEAARAEAEKHAEKIRNERDALLKIHEEQGLRLLEEARAKAVNFTLANQKEIEEQRKQATQEFERANERTQQIHLRANAVEAEGRALVEKELNARREQFEGELQNLWKSEIDRIDNVWTLQAQMADNKRRHEIDLLMKNLELGLPPMLQSTGKMEPEQWAHIFREIQGIVERCFPSSIRQKDRGRWRLTSLFSFRGTKDLDRPRDKSS